MNEFTPAPMCFTYKAGKITYQGSINIAPSVYALAVKGDSYSLTGVCVAVYRSIGVSCPSFKTEVLWKKIKWISQPCDDSNTIPPKELI